MRRTPWYEVQNITKLARSKNKWVVPNWALKSMQWPTYFFVHYSGPWLTRY